MKKFVLSLSIGLSAATFMVACNSNSGAQAEQAKAADTTGLAQFQSAKQQQAFADAAVMGAVAQSASQTRTVTQYVPVRSAAKSSSAKSSSAKSSSSSSTASKEVMQSQTENAAKATKKKGISKAAKGAIIGGVAGAAAGAIINKKNRVVGAVIGGVAGAAGGYGIGRGMDKKDGRYLTTHDFGGYVAQ